MLKKILFLFVFIWIFGYFALLLGVTRVDAIQCVNTAADCDEYCANPCREDPDDPDAVIGINSPSNMFCMCNPLDAPDFPTLIDNITNYIFWIATAIVPVIVLIAAMYFITSGGQTEKVTKARRMIYYAVIGYMVVLFAKGIVALLKSLI